MLNVKADKAKTRNAYRAPQLKVYGGMTKLTANGSQDATEGNGKNDKAMGRA